MAPFRFRKANSSDKKREHDPDPQVNEALLNQHNAEANAASNSSINSIDGSSLVLQGGNANELKSLLPKRSTSIAVLGYENPNKEHSTEIARSHRRGSVPELTQHMQSSHDHIQTQQYHEPFDRHELVKSEQLTKSDENLIQDFLERARNTRFRMQCLHPICLRNALKDPVQRESLEQQIIISRMQEEGDIEGLQTYVASIQNSEAKEVIRKLEEYDTNKMTKWYQEHPQESCSSDCRETEQNCAECQANTSHTYDPPAAYRAASSISYSYTPQDMEEEIRQQIKKNKREAEERKLERQLINSTPILQYVGNKSSKEIYKDLAKKLGITCKMSDGCRCIECQARYFDSGDVDEVDEDNEQHKTDGGLGAGTPLFISDVMHGVSCTIL